MTSHIADNQARTAASAKADRVAAAVHLEFCKLPDAAKAALSFTDFDRVVKAAHRETVKLLLED